MKTFYENFVDVLHNNNIIVISITHKFNEEYVVITLLGSYKIYLYASGKYEISDNFPSLLKKRIQNFELGAR
jgi:hypothetical protein